MRVEPKIVMGLLFLPQIDLVNPYKGIHCCCLSIQEKSRWIGLPSMQRLHTWIWLQGYAHILLTENRDAYADKVA